MTVKISQRVASKSETQTRSRTKAVDALLARICGILWDIVQNIFIFPEMLVAAKSENSQPHQYVKLRLHAKISREHPTTKETMLRPSSHRTWSTSQQA